MSRTPRVVVPGLAHHVTQRGNRQANVFFDATDYRAYLSLLESSARRYGLDIWAYCLMPNHVHLVVVPRTPTSLAHALRDAHTAYAIRLNGKRKLSGHVWQGRFFSSVMDEAHLWHAVRYVERNPVRAGIVACAEQYEWSSAAARCGLRRDPLLSPGAPFEDADVNWTEWLQSEDEERSIVIRRQTHTGRPCGSSEFTRALQSTLGRSIGRGRRGRPP